jgi:hypothetical protein
MALPNNDDFANRELSIEELDAIAGGGWFSSAVHWVEHEAHSIGSGLKSFFTNPVVAGIAAGIIAVGAIVTGGSALRAK